MALFNIAFSDVYGTQVSYASHNLNIQHICASMASSLNALIEAEGFEGYSANSVKAYLKEVHLPLAEGIATLAQLMAQEYAFSFFNKLQAAPIGELQYAAQLDDDDMLVKENSLRDRSEGDLEHAKGCLTSALNSLPGGFTLDMPELTLWQSELESLKRETSSLRRSIKDIDDDASNSFTGERSAVADLKKQIANALSFCGSHDFSTQGYTPGAFDSSGLVGATQRYAPTLQAQYENYLASFKAANALEEQRLQKKYEEEEQKDANWSTVNAVVSLVGCAAGAVVAIAALCNPVGLTTAGLVVAGMAVAGFIVSSVEALRRVDVATNKITGAKERDSDGATPPVKVLLSNGMGTVVEEAIDYDGASLKNPKRFVATAAAEVVATRTTVDGYVLGSDETATIGAVESSAIDIVDGAADLFTKGKRLAGGAGIVGAASDIVVAVGDKEIEKTQDARRDIGKQMEANGVLELNMKDSSHFTWAR